MVKRRPIALLLGVLALVGSAGCSSPSSDTSASSALGDNAITVGSYNFAESEVLAEVYSQALEGGGFAVHRAFDLGSREFVAPALATGLIELVPDYAGAAVQFLSLGSVTPPRDDTQAHSELIGLVAGTRITALAAAPAEDANTFVVKRDLAERHGWSRLSDLATAAPELTVGGPPECPTRPSCLAGLEREYGLHFKEFVALDAGGPLTREALLNGEIDMAVLFTTDPTVDRDDVVELVDDRRLQPAENVTPLVHTEIAERFGPSAAAIVDNVSRRLTTDGLRRLNGRVAQGVTGAVAAKEWLAEQGTP